MAQPRFYVPGVAGERSPIALPADEAHHLMHVLRLGAEARIAVFDGAGREWTARVVSVGKRSGVTIEILARRTAAAEPPVRVTLGVGVLKGDQMDAVVRDATMLGAAVVAPVASDHVSVPARAWQGGAALARWRRLAVASAKQCGRAVVPDVQPVASLASLAARTGADCRLICVEPAADARDPVALAALPRPASALVLVGPEGGWSREEIDRARDLGFCEVSLGPRRLRAETAPTVLLSALWTTWGW